MTADQWFTDADVERGKDAVFDILYDLGGSDSTKGDEVLTRTILAAVVPVRVAEQAAEIERLREALDIQTGLLEEARSALESVKDRMDERAYSELSCPLDDGAADQWGDTIISRDRARLAAVAAVRDELAELHGRVCKGTDESIPLHQRHAHDCGMTAEGIAAKITAALADPAVEVAAEGGGRS